MKNNTIEIKHELKNYLLTHHYNMLKEMILENTIDTSLNYWSDCYFQILEELESFNIAEYQNLSDMELKIFNSDLAFSKTLHLVKDEIDKFKIIK